MEVESICTPIIRHAIVIATILAVALPLSAATDEAEQIPADYKSGHFVLHTDLKADEAEELLDTMESMLRVMSAYWGTTSKKTIECYVVEDLDRWQQTPLPAAILPHVKTGGITVAQTMRIGRRSDTTAVVYSSSKFSTPKHEAVHAFCYQAFGTTGPTWYAEGMAEMGNYWNEGSSAVHCPKYVVNYLRASQRPSIEEMTDPDQQTGDGWKNYAWRWALCHFMVNNPNYRERFRIFGAELLAGRRGSFTRTFDSMKEELEFEFDFFVDHLEIGFDVDRCAWNWKARFRELSDKPITSTIKADRGWQSSGVKVLKGQILRVSAEGEWSISPDSEADVPSSERPDSAPLAATVYDSGTLSDEFVIPLDGTITIPTAGQLMLRCKDRWTELKDNSGQLKVQINLSLGSP